MKSFSRYVNCIGMEKEMSALHSKSNRIESKTHHFHCIPSHRIALHSISFHFRRVADATARASVDIPKSSSSSPSIVDEEPLPSLDTAHYGHSLYFIEHLFPSKLWRILDDAERCGYANVISWVDDGTAFQIREYISNVLHCIVLNCISRSVSFIRSFVHCFVNLW